MHDNSPPLRPPCWRARDNNTVADESRATSVHGSRTVPLVGNVSSPALRFGYGVGRRARHFHRQSMYLTDCETRSITSHLRYPPAHVTAWFCCRVVLLGTCFSGQLGHCYRDAAFPLCGRVRLVYRWLGGFGPALPPADYPAPPLRGFFRPPWRSFERSLTCVSSSRRAGPLAQCCVFADYVVGNFITQWSSARVLRHFACRVYISAFLSRTSIETVVFALPPNRQLFDLAARERDLLGFSPWCFFILP